MSRTILTETGKKTVAYSKEHGTAYSFSLDREEQNNDSTKKLFEGLKSRKRWTDSDKITFARWTVYKFLRNLYGWSNTQGKKKGESVEEWTARVNEQFKHSFATNSEARDYFRQLADAKIVRDYAHIETFDITKRQTAVGGVESEAYNLISWSIDFLYSHKVKNWDDFFNRQIEIEKPTKKTFRFMDEVGLVTIEVSFKTAFYRMLSDMVECYKKTEYNSDKLTAEKVVKGTNGEGYTVYESQTVADVFTSDYIVPKVGKSRIDTIDVSKDTIEALEVIAEKARLTKGEKLVILFKGYAKLSDSKVRKSIKAYDGTDYSFSRIESAYEKAMIKLSKVYNK